MPSFFGGVTRTLGRLDFAGQDLHQRGFAGAVRPGNGVAPPRKKRARDVFEQDSGAEAHRDVVNGEQGDLNCSNYLPSLHAELQMGAVLILGWLGF